VVNKLASRIPGRRPESRPGRSAESRRNRAHNMARKRSVEEARIAKIEAAQARKDAALALIVNTMRIAPALIILGTVKIVKGMQNHNLRKLRNK
jgi:hypothetical protein